jgi:hypothetical protein
MRIDPVQLNSHTEMCTSSAGPYYTIGTVDTVPRAYGKKICGLWPCLMDRIFGPFFFVQPTVVGGVYLDCWYSSSNPPPSPQVQDLQPNIIHQQDGTSSQLSLHIWETQLRSYANRRIRRNGAIAWPPRSPDVTPPDRVHATRVPGFQTRVSIRDEIALVTPAVLDRTWQETEHRLYLIRVTSGS